LDDQTAHAAGNGVRDPLTAAEPAMMHVISGFFSNTKVADTIRYDTPSIGSDTIPIR